MYGPDTQYIYGPFQKIFADPWSRSISILAFIIMPVIQFEVLVFFSFNVWYEVNVSHFTFFFSHGCAVIPVPFVEKTTL